MKNFRFLALFLLLTLPATLAKAQGSADQLKSYMDDKEKIKALELDAVKKIAADPREKFARRGLAEYYIFLKAPKAEGDVAANTKLAGDLEKAADIYMDPSTYIKLAALYSRDFPDYGAKRDLAKQLRYLSIVWEIADLSDKATGNNDLLTLVVNNTLGMGDGLFGGDTDKAELMKAMNAIRPDVLKARARFKKLYGLSIKDELPNSTNLERHYGVQ